MTYQIHDFSMSLHATDLITVSSFSYINAADRDVLTYLWLRASDVRKVGCGVR